MYKDIANQRFSKLVAIKRVGSNKNGESMWLLRCDCGNETTVRLAHVIDGNTKSCGCLRHPQDDLSKSAAYKSYVDAYQRCTNQRRKEFHNYGGRGIKFLFLNFAQFFSELGNRPPGLTLDRIDNNDHYRPGNVRWADRKTQNNNTRRKR